MFSPRAPQVATSELPGTLGGVYQHHELVAEFCVCVHTCMRVCVCVCVCVCVRVCLP